MKKKTIEAELMDNQLDIERLEEDIARCAKRINELNVRRMNLEANRGKLLRAYGCQKDAINFDLIAKFEPLPTLSTNAL